MDRHYMWTDKQTFQYIGKSMLTDSYLDENGNLVGRLEVRVKETVMLGNQVKEKVL